jgi:hypothetical protein
MVNDLDLNKTDLLETAQALQAALAEVSQENIKRLDVSEAQRAQLHQFMREQEALIQEMKFQFNQEVVKIRQAFCKSAVLPAMSSQSKNPDPTPLD